MLTSNLQYKASKEAAKQLNVAINAPVNSELSAKMIEANRAKMRRKLTQIEAEIWEYERNRKLKLEEIKINSLDDLLVAPIVYRLAKHETVEEFAKEIGVNKRQILRYEAEKYQNCSISTLQQILNKIGIVLEGHLSKAGQY